MTFLLAILLAASGASSPGDAILGTWHGTSICVDRARFPACNDEVVVFTFRSKGDDPMAVSLRADKVVDGKAGLMGKMDFTFDAAQDAWLSEFRNSRVHIIWNLAVRNGKIEGTVVDLPDRHLVRRVVAEKK